MNDKIKESRLLFQRKGIMRREFLRNEIALSWARSQVFNVDTEKLEINETIRAKKLSYKESKIYSFIDAILIFKDDNSLVRYYQRDPDKQFSYMTYTENNLGTNGIGLSKNFKRPFYVSAYEHYHQYLFDKITFGFPLVHEDQEIIIGFVLSLTTKDFLNKQSDIENLALDISQKIQLNEPSLIESNSPIQSINTDGKSPIMKSYNKKIADVETLDNHLFLQGKKGSGKEITARLIHENSIRKNQKFYSLYCDKVPTDILIEKITNQFFKSIETDRSDLFGTIYCEGFETLPYKIQELLTRLLESKPINSKQLNASNSNAYRLIFASEKSLEDLFGNKLIHAKLKNRINLFTIKIPELREIKEDLPFLINKGIEKYTSQFLIEPVLFTDDLMNFLIRYDWPENYRELDKVIESLIYKGRSEKIIDKAYLPSYLRKNEAVIEEIIPLEITEKQQIIRALEIMNFNMALTAKALGIGRSTLYRKLDKYNIEI